MEPESFRQLLALVRDLGFPAGVAFFVLWRLEGRLKELTDAVNALRDCLSRRPP